MLSTLFLFLGMPLLALAIPYSEYIYAPTSRTLYPRSIHFTNGTVKGASKLLGSPNGGLTTFHDSSSITYDFGQTIEGILSITIASSPKSQDISVSFTESSIYIFPDASDSTDVGLDVPLFFSGVGAFTAEPEYRRGAFRYLTVASHGVGAVKLSELSVYFTAYPQAAEGELKDYAGYFHDAGNDKLNRVWYAGAWTCQLCVIDPTTGDAVVHNDGPVGSAEGYDLYPWYNNITVSNGTAVLVDGAKRDRLVWPGDYAVSIATSAVSFGDLDPVRTGLDSLFVLQEAAGALPYTGTPIWQNLFLPGGTWSYTYHVHTLSGLYQYYMFTGDAAYIKGKWDQAVLGLQYALTYVDETGLANIPGYSADWGRGDTGGYNNAANALLYRALNQYITLTTKLYAKPTQQMQTLVTNWTTYANNLNTSFNALLWNSTAGLYNDNPTNPTLQPQDGNAFAILANLSTPARSTIISRSLASRWTNIGAPAPEAGTTISPFASSFELEAHFVAGETESAVELIEMMYYDFMMADPRMTNSTFIEGYRTDGALIYAYSDNPRLSFTHGWSTGPTSSLSQYVVGIQFADAAGKRWRFAPQVTEEMTDVQAGYASPLGMFQARYTTLTTGGGSFLYQFEAPKGTSGSVLVMQPVGCTGSGNAVLRRNSGGFAGDVEANAAIAAGSKVAAKKVPKGQGYVEFDGVKGGDYALLFTCVD